MNNFGDSLSKNHHWVHFFCILIINLALNNLINHFNDCVTLSFYNNIQNDEHTDFTFQRQKNTSLFMFR